MFDLLIAPSSQGLEPPQNPGRFKKLYALEDINALLDDLEEVCKEQPVLILVDELDKGWDASEDAIAFVAGLFQAGASISIRTPSIRVVITLRRELFESIPSLNDDAQKLRDTVEVIDWRDQELLALIAKRIRHSLELPDDVSDHLAWTKVMPPTLWSRPSFDAILDFTLWRPRELIHICGQILDVARHTHRTLPFSESDIDEAVGRYSKERCSDIVAEFRFQYPGLMSVMETFRGGPVILSRGELELHCLKLSTGDLRVEEQARWCLDREPHELIGIMWKIGFLRAKLGSSTGAHEYQGAYQVPSANVGNSPSFRIHEVFARYLDCQR